MSYTPVLSDEQARLHVHEHSGLTTCDKGHSHLHPGVTGPPIQSGASHYHQFFGQTSYDHGHYHIYHAVTGMAIMLPDGQHTHFVSTKTSYNFGHCHGITGYVTPAPDENQQSPCP